VSAGLIAREGACEQNLVRVAVTYEVTARAFEGDGLGPFDVADGEPGFAADPALENSHFYNTVLKNYVTPWTNEDQTHNSSLISM
jgi:hypothetical protein